MSSFLGLYLAGISCCAIAWVLAMRTKRLTDLALNKAVSSCILFSSLGLLVIQVCKYYALRNYADFAIWMELLSNALNTSGPHSTLQDNLIPGTGNWFASHFTPLMYIFAPILIFFGPVGLLTAQFFALQATIMLVYLLARHYSRNHEISMTIAAACSLHPTYQYIHLYEFEMLRFTMPVVLAAWYFFETSKYKLGIVAFAAVLLMREDAAFTAFGLGILLALTRNNRLLGVSLAAASIAYFAVVSFIVMPSFRTSGSGHIASFWFADIGQTPSEILLTIISRPVHVAAVMLAPLKIANVVMLLIPFGMAALTGPAILAAIPAISLLALSQSPTHLSYFMYYVSPALAVIFIAGIMGAVRFGRSGAAALLVTACIANLFFAPSPFSFQFWLKNYRVAPFRTQNFHYSHYIPRHGNSLRGALAHIPADAFVSAEQHLLPLVYQRRGMNVFPDLRNSNYAFIDRNNPIKTGTATVPGSWDGLRRNPQEYYRLVENAPNRWSRIYSDSGLEVYKRL